MDWEKIYAPAELQLSDTIEELDITEYLSRRSSVRLEHIKSNGMQARFLASLLGILVIMVGIAWYFNVPQIYFDSIKDKLSQLKENTLQQSGLSSQSLEPPPMPWINQFQGIPVLMGCVNSINEFPASIPGWSIAELICNGNIASARLTRMGKLGETGGSVNWIIPYIQKPDFDPKLVWPQDGSKDLVEVNWIFQPYPLIETDIETTSVSVIRELLLRMFEERMTPITFTQTDSNEFWHGVGFQFTAQYNPLDFADILSLVPGLIITTIHYEPNFGNWTIKGKAYEQLSTYNSQTY